MYVCFYICMYICMYVCTLYVLSLSLYGWCYSPQVIMKDKWMNIGYEEDELKPYMEPDVDLNDQIRIRKIQLCVCVCVCAIRL